MMIVVIEIRDRLLQQIIRQRLRFLVAQITGETYRGVKA